MNSQNALLSPCLKVASRILALSLLLLLAGKGSPLLAEEARKTNDGIICIAPFRNSLSMNPKNQAPEIELSNTPAPTKESTFVFSFDGKQTTTPDGSRATIVSGLPSNGRIRVSVRLDGKPFETFWLDLGASPGHKICLWLYPGYWHWIDNGWQTKLGCSLVEQQGSSQDAAANS